MTNQLGETQKTIALAAIALSLIWWQFGWWGIGVYLLMVACVAWTARVDRWS